MCFSPGSDWIFASGVHDFPALHLNRVGSAGSPFFMISRRRRRRYGIVSINSMFIFYSQCGGGLDAFVSSLEGVESFCVWKCFEMQIWARDLVDVRFSAASLGAFFARARRSTPNKVAGLEWDIIYGGKMYNTNCEEPLKLVEWFGNKFSFEPVLRNIGSRSNSLAQTL